MARWFVYILRCKNNSLYTGITNNLDSRVAKHQAGKGAKYTRAFGPVQLVYAKVMKSPTAARKLEAQIKTWTKAKKEEIVNTYGKNS